MIYLDYAASTPIDKRVCHAMAKFLDSEHFANASARHFFGKKVNDIVELSRYLVANLIGADQSEIIWTSGCTESNNLGIIGTALANQHIGKHLITLKTEHESVLRSFQYLETVGFNVTYLSPKADGLVNFEELQEKITNQTLLISMMFVNNETGVIQNIKEIGELARKKGIVFHVDAAQAAGKLPINAKELKIDLMSLSAHKMYGPKGVGVLYIDRNSNLEIRPVLYGGLQERGMRPGTLATHQIIGFAEACKIAKEEMLNDFDHVNNLRNYFLDRMGKLVRPNLPLSKTLPYISSVLFLHLNEKERQQLEGSETIMLSSRATCSTYKKTDYSHVLEALCIDKESIKKTYRISFGKFTTKEEIDLATNILTEISLRKT